MARSKGAVLGLLIRPQWLSSLARLFYPASRYRVYDIENA